MQLILIEKETNKAHFFKAGTDAGIFLNRTPKTLNDWMKQGNIHTTDKYIVLFDVEEHRAEGKGREGRSFSR